MLLLFLFLQYMLVRFVETLAVRLHLHLLSILEVILLNSLVDFSIPSTHHF